MILLWSRNPWAQTVPGPLFLFPGLRPFLFEHTEQESSHHRPVCRAIRPAGSDRAGPGAASHIIPVKEPGQGAYRKTGKHQLIALYPVFHDRWFLPMTRRIACPGPQVQKEGNRPDGPILHITAERPPRWPPPDPLGGSPNTGPCPPAGLAEPGPLL